jgi:putative ABC transport system permease protein
VIESIVRDVGFAFRSFRKSPGFAATIVLTVALSIGATTAMFSIVKGVLLDPLPFGNGDRLVWTVNRGTRPYDAMSPLDLRDWSRLVPSFEAVASWAPSAAILQGGGTEVHLSIAEVTDNWFSVLGVAPQLGRGFAANEQGEGKAKVAVISDGLWRATFGADRGVVGRTALLDGTRYTVIGVAPRGFDYPDHVDVWRPIGLTAAVAGRRVNRVFRGPIALLRHGVSFAQVQREARVASAQIKAEDPAAEAGLSYDIQPLHDQIVGNTSTPLVILLAAVGTLLLIACVNVAALLVVRASARSAELGIRLALGAGRRRIGTQLLTESLLLALMGGALGTMLAFWGVRALANANVGSLPLVANVEVDPGVLLFALVVTVVAGTAFGLMPSLQAGRTNIVDAIRAGSRGAGSTRRAARTRIALVALEMALVVPLLVGASLLARSFSRLLTADPGFRAEHLVRFDVSLPMCGTPWLPDTTCAAVSGTHYNRASEERRFWDELLTRLRALPGTEAASIGFGAPFSDWSKQQGALSIQGKTVAGQVNPVESKLVKPGYFAALGTQILQGRDFNAQDYRGRDYCSHVAIVSEGAVKAYFGGVSPIGAQLTGLCDSTATVIGVVADVKTQSLASAPEPALYQSSDENPLYVGTVLIRSRADPGTVMAAARRAVAAVDKTVPIYHMQTMQDAVENAAAPARLAARVVSGFAIAALLLAVIGIYGLIAYVVRERRRELGIRIALGAQPRQVVALALKGGLVAVGSGVVAGVAVAVAGSRVLRGLLYGIAPTDVNTYVTACAALIAVTVVAAWIPGREAARVDPLIAMRPE